MTTGHIALAGVYVVGLLVTFRILGRKIWEASRPPVDGGDFAWGLLGGLGGAVVWPVVLPVLVAVLVVEHVSVERAGRALFGESRERRQARLERERDREGRRGHA